LWIQSFNAFMGTRISMVRPGFRVSARTSGMHS
jgi:hypothetical protein